LAVLCIVGMFLKTWYAYEADMQAQEARAPWGTQRPAAQSVSPPPPVEPGPGR
jgi:hypothetical protein